MDVFSHRNMPENSRTYIKASTHGTNQSLQVLSRNTGSLRPHDQITDSW